MVLGTNAISIHVCRLNISHSQCMQRSGRSGHLYLMHRHAKLAVAAFPGQHASILCVGIRMAGCVYLNKTSQSMGMQVVIKDWHIRVSLAMQRCNGMM